MGMSLGSTDSKNLIKYINYIFMLYMYACIMLVHASYFSRVEVRGQIVTISFFLSVCGSWDGAWSFRPSKHPYQLSLLASPLLQLPVQRKGSLN